MTDFQEWAPSRLAGSFIALEGLNGSGKTTQARRLAAFVESRLDLPVTHIKNPPPTWLGGVIRQYFDHHSVVGDLTAESEILLLAAGTRDLIERSIRPALLRGHCVICERYTLSSWAYQGARGASVSILRRAAELATGGLAPHLTILLDIDAALAVQRLGPPETRDRMEQRGAPYLEKVRALLSQHLPDMEGPTAVVDAGASPEIVAAAIWRRICEALVPLNSG